MFGKKPGICEVVLKKHYRFMYENFVISTQHDSYLLLDSDGKKINALKFHSSNIKYGGPNDEARGAHPLSKYGAMTYGLYEVKNSPWIKEQMEGNRIHPSHSDSMFDGMQHYNACFKDVVFEVTCRSWEEITLTNEEITGLVHNELSQLVE